MLHVGTRRQKTYLQTCPLCNGAEVGALVALGAAARARGPRGEGLVELILSDPFIDGLGASEDSPGLLGD